MRILITGSAGYIGSMLVNRLIKEGARAILGIDLRAQPEQIPRHKNLKWITHDLSQRGWEGFALQNGPFDAVVHLAFKIRSPYGKTEAAKEENLAASGRVFEFAFKNKIPRLIYSSSVAAYGAKKENIGRLLQENDRLLENKSPYGFQKRLVEEMLVMLFAKLRPPTNTVVVRLNSVTGPVGQGLGSKFGLITFLKKLLPFVIETHPAWARQFIHERDVEEILVKLLEAPPKKGSFDIYNAAPPSYLTAKDIARVLGKKTIRFPQPLVRPAFWLAWHGTLGRIPTHPDSADGLIYPINVDSSKLKKLGLRYRFGPAEALLGKSEPEKR